MVVAELAEFDGDGVAAPRCGGMQSTSVRRSWPSRARPASPWCRGWQPGRRSNCRSLACSGRPLTIVTSWLPVPQWKPHWVLRKGSDFTEYRYDGINDLLGTAAVRRNDMCATTEGARAQSVIRHPRPVRHTPPGPPLRLFLNEINATPPWIPGYSKPSPTTFALT